MYRLRVSDVAGLIVILTGPPGAGKTTVAEELARRRKLAFHLETDKFLGAIKSGYVMPWLPEAEGQGRTLHRAAARAVGVFSELFDVFVEGVIWPEQLAIYDQELRGVGPLHVVCLMPEEDEAVRRATTRQNTHGITEERFRLSYKEFSAVRQLVAVVLDTTNQGPLETVDAVERIVPALRRAV